MIAEADAGGIPLAADALIGKVVGGRFRIESRIAQGGMSSVYFATQTPLNRPVAVKVLRGSLGADAESADGFRRRFLQEASILSLLSHPNIVTLLEYGQVQELPAQPYFMAMEYLRGQTLAQRFRQRGRLGVEECIRIARQIGRGLREAHRRGFVHRDLKPSNIILVPEDERNDIVKLVDFGIGKVLGGPVARADEDDTRIGLLLGSPRHMAPEQIRCGPVEVRTDMYGLGVILFQALTGQLPFDGHTDIDVLMAHCSMPAPDLKHLAPELPASLSSLVDSLLAKQPSGRPTVDEFLQRLGAVEQELFGQVGLAGPTSRHAAPTLRPPSRHDLERDVTQATEVEWRSELAALQASGALASSTPHALASAEATRRGRWTLAAGIVALAGAAGFTLQNLRASRAVSPVAGALVVEARRGTERTSGRPPSAAVRSFALGIASVPAGARVSENGAFLGSTPLTLSIARDSVAGHKRRFLLEREGYAPYVVEQGDSEAPVDVSATLASDARKSARSHGSGNNLAAPLGAAAAEGSAAKRNKPVVLDIRTRR